MLPNLESSKALLSTVKVMMINARVVVSPLNAQYILSSPAVQSRKETGMTESYRRTGHSEWCLCRLFLPTLTILELH